VINIILSIYPIFYSTATYLGNLNLISLSSNTNGQINFQLPQGPQSDTYKIYLVVNVKDNSNGVTTYNISTPVTVLSNDTSVQSLTDSILNLNGNGSNSQILNSLNSGDTNLVTSNVLALTSLINAQSTSDNSSSNSDNSQMKLLRDFMADKVTQLSVTDVNSIRMIGAALSSITQETQQVSVNTAVNFICYFEEH
jgi:hypothetical protein